MADSVNKDSSNASTSAAVKKPLAELKNGKVIFKQKPISFEKSSEAMQEIVKFREMIEQRLERQDPPLTAIPDEHKSLIVKLAQESDKGLSPLAKHIRSEILPSFDEEDSSRRERISTVLPLLVVEHTIQSLMVRTNYGLDGPLGYRLPSIVCVWRWEVRDAYRDWLPKSAREKAETRITERIQAKIDLRTVFEGLPQDERDAIIDPKGTNKLPPKDTNKPNLPSNATPEQTDSAERKDSPSLREPSVTTNEPENIDSENGIPKARQRKATDLEKAAKTKEKEEKRVARAEREKKQKETQDKSRSLMANFFGKAKAPQRQSPLKAGHPVSGTSKGESEFQKTFKPFILKKDAEIAPNNWFLKSKQRLSGKQRSGYSHADAIVVDPDQTSKTEAVDVSIDSTSAFNVAGANARDRLEDIVRSLQPLRLTQPRGRSKSSFKCFSACNVRDIFAQLNDAEIAGDTSQVRYLLNILRDRKMLPAKVLIFHEDARPGYYGSWTRNSPIIGPRSPFARDLLARDYGYDSGEEWEDEGPGDADNVDDDEDEEAEGDDADSDADSWLVDDEEVEESVPDDRELSPSLLDIPLPSHKRKAISPPLLDISHSASKRKAEANTTNKQPEKKRKVVIPLVPYTKGPLWESVIGHCEYDPFRPYRIQLFNDTPYPIDPFAFVSVPIEESQPPNPQAKFAVPSLPNRLSGNNAAESAAAQVPANKRTTAASTPKTTFPDAHVPLLLDKITSLATTNLTFIVESVHQELRAHKVKKNAIEAKVREVAEKSKEKKIWVVTTGRPGQ